MRWFSRIAFVLLYFLFGSKAGVHAQAQASVEVRVVESPSLSPLANAHVELRAHDKDSVIHGETLTHGTFRFAPVESGDYRLHVEATGHIPRDYDFVLKPRQNLALTLELAEGAPVERVEVHDTYTSLDPAQTGTSRVLTRAMLDKMPSPLRQDVQSLVLNVSPGAILSHDNFVHVRSNELSLHEFINGVSFLDNTHQQFTPGMSPQIFDWVNVITGGFGAEYGNRFGGVLDITTRSGQSLGGHGSISASPGSVGQHDAAVDYGGSIERFGYYFYASGFTSDRFLNPPVAREEHDRGNGARTAAQFDWAGAKDSFKLLLTGDGSNFELPNTPQDTLDGRDASRRVRAQTAILSWQHTLSPRGLLATSFYERDVSDHLLPTSDPVTPFGSGSRSTLTTGLKSDLTYARGGHTIKTGLDLTLLRLRESFDFDPRDPADDLGPLSFQGRDLGGQVSLYFQDHFSPARNFTVDAGLRWDQANIVGSYAQVSPRVGLAYHLDRMHGVLHFTYNRFFAPPPLEYVVLASFIGGTHPDLALRTDNVRPYTQNYFEAGWTQQLHPKVTLEVDAYLHRGKNAFETSEISNTRLFLPTNFAKAHAQGAEVSLVLRQLERIGISGKIQYALSRVEFFGPVSGGFADEDIAPGERIPPAFDERHTGTADIFYRSKWKSAWTGFTFRYGSGTATEEDVLVAGMPAPELVRLPQHFTADFGAGITPWEKESHALKLEFNVTNIGNRIYEIAKESETTPVQFSARRVVSGRITWKF